MSDYGDHIDYNTGQKCDCSSAISGGHYRGAMPGAEPRIWWCEVRYMGFTGPASACVTHAKCGWVRLVDDPQEGGEE